MPAGKILARVGFFSLVAAAVLYPGHRRLVSFNEQLGALEREIEELKKSNRALEDEIEAVRTDPFIIEKHARDMGFIREGEKIYRVRFREPYSRED